MNRRSNMVRWVLLPSVVVAALFLAWWSYRATRELEGVRGRSLSELADGVNSQVVKGVEDHIVASDNNVITESVDPDDLDTLATQWPNDADRVSPTVRSVIVLDEEQHVLRHVSRADAESAARFRRLFEQRIAPALHLDQEPAGSHKHLHDEFEGQSVMVSYLTRQVGSRRYFVVLEADLDYIRNVLLRDLVATPSASGHFNVVDQENRVVFGGPFASRTDFMVSRGFPTTVYQWRLWFAPRAGPDLNVGTRRRRWLDGVLVALSLVVLMAGVAFLGYAARNEQRLNRLKSDFIATVSHELKTPLSLIRMFGEMLSTGRAQSDGRRREYLDIIVRESERLTGLIENLLDFAKLERGKAAYEFSTGNLVDLVTRGLDLFRYRLDGEKTHLVTDIEGEIPDIALDEHAMQLLLFNLLDNAVKYAGADGNIIVRIRAHPRHVVLEVEDHGPGIPLEDRKRIFERFYRGKSAGSAGARGSGIGLALVKNIAEAHGGSVRVRDAPDRGAVFVVSLPARDTGDEPVDTHDDART